MSEPIVQPLGWALIHSLWQGAAVALAFAVLNFLFRNASANCRYVLGCAAMLVTLACPAATFVAFANHDASTAAYVRASGETFMPGPVAVPLGPMTPQVPVSGRYIAIIVWIWAAGVIAMSIWSAAGWVIVQRLKHRSKVALAKIWQARVAALAVRLGISRRVQVCESALMRIPAAIGWIRPVILVPACALVNLSAEELEAVLAHELAHIRRFDYVVNLLQTGVETLMFYHPAVWWIGRHVRAERENCCDDLAIATCGSRIMYARALTTLEELRCAMPQFAMAAARGSLAARIRRLLGAETPRSRTLPSLSSIAIITVAIVAAWSSEGRGTMPKPALVDPVPFAAVAPEIPAAPLPRTAPVRLQAPEWRQQMRAHIAARQPAQVYEISQVTPHTGEGYLAGLTRAGYTNISVDEIIELKNNGVSPEYIAGILHAGLGVPNPKQLIELRNNNVRPEYARAAADAHVPDLNFRRVIELQQNGVNLDSVRQIHALGFGPYTIEQIIDFHRNGVRASLFEALKSIGLKNADARTMVEAQRNGLSPESIHRLRDQGFKSLTLEQIIKLRRAGVI